MANERFPGLYHRPNDSATRAYGLWMCARNRSSDDESPLEFSSISKENFLLLRSCSSGNSLLILSSDKGEISGYGRLPVNGGGSSKSHPALALFQQFELQP